MKFYAFSLVLLAFPTIGRSQFGQKFQVNLQVENITAQECPNIIAVNKVVEEIKMEIYPTYTVGGVDSLKLVDSEGKTQHITFPGCYNVKLKMKLRRRIDRPYAEMFMQMGGEIPCRRPDNYTTTIDACRNTSLPFESWCPRSGNQKLRRLAALKETCHTCNLCGNARNAIHQNSRNGRKKFLEAVPYGGEITDDCSVGNMIFNFLQLFNE